jgi:hypothetical protein
MAWMKMRTNLWDDPRVSRMCDLTGRPEATVIGALYWLWATADEHSADGSLAGYTLAQIDRKTGVKGFGAAIVAIGWLEETGDGVRIVRFDDHNGTSAKQRALTAKRVAEHSKKPATANAELTHEALVDRKATVSSALAREREREREREEKEKTSPPAAVPDPRSELWANAVSMLRDQGLSEPSARSFIGLQCRSWDEDTVADAFSAAAGQANVRAYVSAVLKTKPRKGEKPVGVEYRNGQATIGGFVP